MIQKFRKAVNPPYSRKDLPVILLTLCFLLIIPITLIFLNQRTIFQGQAANERLRIQPNDYARGLVFDGLEEDITGKCKGLLVVKSNDPDNPALDYSNCTHGPDPAPEGFDVAKSVPPVAESTAEEPVLGTTVTCEGDGQSGFRTHIIYARSSDKADRFNQYLTSFQTWAAGMDTIFNASAQETGGSRHIRFVHDQTCTPIIDNVVMSTTGDDNFGNTKNELTSKGYTRTDRKYLVFVDANVLCGIANIQGDTRVGSENNNNKGPQFGRVDSGCWGASVAAHELMHNLGGVQLNAPHTSKGWHCYDDYDRMCYDDGHGVAVQRICTNSAQEQRFDCNDDDYYSTNPPAGSYLANNWNSANNIFLIGGGTSTQPTPTSAFPTNTPTPTIPLPVGSNLLLNSSFETNNNGTPLNWTRGVYDTAVKRTGIASVRIDGNGGDVYAYQQPPLKPSTTYTIQGYIRTANVASTDFGVHIRYGVTGGTASVNYTQGVSGTTDWTFVSRTFTTPADYSNGRYDLHVVTSGTAWFDDVAICEGTCSTTTVPTNTPAPTSFPTPTRTPTPISGDTIRPSITITNPTNGAIVQRRGDVTVTASATDNVGVDRVTFSVDGNTSTDFSPPYSYSWSVSGKPNARYTITATAYDAANNSSSQTISVTSSR